MKKLLQFPLMAMYQLIKIRRKTTEKEKKEKCFKIEIASLQTSRNDKGLSLVEVLVAVSIVSILLVSMVAAITKSMASARVSKNRSLASSYLQEGLEYVRQRRDQADTWEDFVNISFADVPNNGFVRSVDNSSCSVADDKCRVIVTVNWTDSKGVHDLTASTILSNW